MKLISFVTIVYNDLVGLKKTVDSVDEILLNSSSIDSFQHVIIDGKSSDGTAEFAISLARSRMVDTVVISEEDNGIYDAMNKGVCRASGEGVIFLNAGDILHPDCNLESVLIDFKKLMIGNTRPGIVYGSIFKIGALSFMINPRLVDLSAPRMPGSHQAMLYRKAVLLKFPFDARFKICGDYDNFSAIRVTMGDFEPINRVFSIFYAGGVSSQKPLKLFKESYFISAKRYNLNYTQKISLSLRLFSSLLIIRSLLFGSRLLDLISK